MKSYEVRTLWATVMMGIIIFLIMLGGYYERGYIAFDSAFIILFLSPVILVYTYRSEKEKYEYRKHTYRQERRNKNV